MKPLSEITALVVDHGLFLPTARKLAETYKRVLYYTPWEEGFAKIGPCILGDGFPDVERCDDIWSVKNDVDLFCFFDIQHAGLQIELESQGRSVWGPRNGDSLELNREKFHKVLGEVGLDVPPFKRIIGLTKLRDHLAKVEDKYIKISKYRGSHETWHWRDWSLDETMLDVLAVRFGPAKELIPFLVFDAIPTDLEIGVDTYMVDGRWPDTMLHGIEAKDKAYFSSVTKRDEMPDQVQDVLNAFSPVFEKYRSRTQFSAEIRVAGDKAYFIDSTIRGGLPSTASQIELWGNFAEIVAAGADGVLIEPEPTAMFSCEAILTTKIEKHAWATVEVPKALQKWMKLSTCCEIDGRVCFPKDEDQGDAIGWLVAIGNTPDEALENIKEYADLLPPGVTAHTDSLIDVLKNIHTGEEEGIEFTRKPIPEPEEVIA